MEFRPCIDIHNGKVKQIIGGSLRDDGNMAEENFVSEQDAAFFANLYKNAGIKGGHVILLNAQDSRYYAASKEQAYRALAAYPQGLQVGGGIHAANAKEFLLAGASHVIVTSYVFREGRIDYERLEALCRAIGREHLVLDLSCKKKPDGYVIMTERWQRETEELVTETLLDKLSAYCDEFLVHAVDVEGKQNGVERELVTLLGGYEGNPVTYAGGVHSFEDLRILKELGRGRVHVTVGSALDLFGGSMDFNKVLAYMH